MCCTQCNPTGRCTKKSARFFSQSNGYKNVPKEKNNLVKVIAEALTKKNYVTITGNPKKCFNG